MNDLNAELSQDQLRLLLAIALPYISDGVWPVWHYVEARLDSQDLDARELIHSLPRVGSTGLTGLSYGFTSALPHYLGDEERVRLTVAAALPLGELRPYFAEPFLRVLHHMIGLQRGVVPSPAEVTRVWLDSTELAVALPWLKPDFIARLPELLDGEPATRLGSGSTSAEGIWRKEITREVLRYRKATDLEGYVAAVCEMVTENAEQQAELYGQPRVSRPSSAPVRTVPKPELPIDRSELTSASFGGMVEFDRKTPYLPRLLLWLAAAAKANPGQLIDPRAFGEQEEIEQEIVDSLLTVLQDRGQVAVLPPEDAGGGASCEIAPEGRAEARRLRQARENKGARLKYAHTAIVHWLFENHGGRTAELATFLTSSDSYFHGDALTGDELLTAVRYLADRGLLAASTVETGLRLTADGQDCAISGGTVSDYLARPSGSGDHYTINGGVQGAVIGGKHQNVTQTNTYGLNLAEVGQLVQVAALARQINPTLGLPEAEEAEILESAQALELEASNPAPDQGRLQRAANRFTAALGSATQATAGLTMLIEQGHKAYSAVFGG